MKCLFFTVLASACLTGWLHGQIYSSVHCAPTSDLCFGQEVDLLMSVSNGSQQAVNFPAEWAPTHISGLFRPLSFSPLGLRLLPGERATLIFPGVVFPPGAHDLTTTPWDFGGGITNVCTTTTHLVVVRCPTEPVNLEEILSHAKSGVRYCSCELSHTTGHDSLIHGAASAFFIESLPDTLPAFEKMLETNDFHLAYIAINALNRLARSAQDHGHEHSSVWTSMVDRVAEYYLRSPPPTGDTTSEGGDAMFELFSNGTAFMSPKNRKQVHTRILADLHSFEAWQLSPTEAFFRFRVAAKLCTAADCRPLARLAAKHYMVEKVPSMVREFPFFANAISTTNSASVSSSVTSVTVPYRRYSAHSRTSLMLSGIVGLGLGLVGGMLLSRMSRSRSG